MRIEHLPAEKVSRWMNIVITVIWICTLVFVVGVVIAVEMLLKGNF